METFPVPNMADVPENALYVWSGRPVKLFLRKAFHFRKRVRIPEPSAERPMERVIQINIHFEFSSAERLLTQRRAFYTPSRPAALQVRARPLQSVVLPLFLLSPTFLLATAVPRFAYSPSNERSSRRILSDRIQ